MAPAVQEDSAPAPEVDRQTNHKWWPGESDEETCQEMSSPAHVASEEAACAPP